MSQLSTSSTNVWIRDIYHPHYPNYVKILEINDEGITAQVQTSVGKLADDGPTEVFHEEQLTDELIC